MSDEWLPIRWERVDDRIERAVLGSVEIGRVNTSANAWLSPLTSLAPIWRRARTATSARQALVDAVTSWVLAAGLSPAGHPQPPEDAR